MNAALPCYRRRNLCDRVCAALRVEADLEAAPRLFATVCACRDSAACETPLRGSRFKAFSRARERFRETGSPRYPLRYALVALFRVFSEVLPLAGGGSLTPARRASESPMAM